MVQMKDSEVEWIGKIPCNWKISKIDSLYSPRITKVSDVEFQPLSVTMKGIVPQLETAAKTNAHDSRKLVKKGDFAINSRSDRRGSCGISEYTGSVSLINTVLMPTENMIPRYFNWLFHTSLFADEFYKWGHGIVDDLWSTGWQEMRKISIPFPTLTEQQKIADFLDRKCSEIDSLSADLQKQIDILEEYKKSVISEAVTKGLNPDVEMKDSGVEYIGTYPSLWTLKKLKYTFKERNERSLTGSELLLSVSQYKGVIPSSENTMRTMQPNSLIGYKKVYKDDLVFNKLNPTLARFGKSEYEGITSPEFSIYIIDSNQLYTKFLEYILRTEKYSKEYGRITLGVGDGYTRLYTNQLGNVYVAVPSLVEQEQILLFLKSIIDEIDKTLSEKKEQLTTLAEYKKSLVYEYVTGKKEVI